MRSDVPMESDIAVGEEIGVAGAGGRPIERGVRAEVGRMGERP